MESSLSLYFIPVEAKRVEHYFHKACKRDINVKSRIAAIGMAVICSAGNSIIYSVGWYVRGVVSLDPWISTDNKKKLQDQMQQKGEDFYKSSVFVVKIVTLLISSGLDGFKNPVRFDEKCCHAGIKAKRNFFLCCVAGVAVVVFKGIQGSFVKAFFYAARLFLHLFLAGYFIVLDDTRVEDLRKVIEKDLEGVFNILPFS
jgi:hypothetical protein